MWTEEKRHSFENAIREVSTSLFLSSSAYLSSLSSVADDTSLPTAATVAGGEVEVVFSHAKLSSFALDLLSPEGPRENADVGQPHDSSLDLVEDVPSPSGATTSSGSWWCAAGGWPSPSSRTTTEIFLVLSGYGCLTDIDDTRHYFGPGDTVILPKGWSGRWDVLQDIHKVWFVVEHPNIEETTSNPIRAVVVYHNQLVANSEGYEDFQEAADLGSPSTALKNVYDADPISVGSWTCSPGSFTVDDLDATVGFHVLEGIFFLTNAADGTARRCLAGDTVVLPEGWSGQWDVMELVEKLWVVID